MTVYSDDIIGLADLYRNEKTKVEFLGIKNNRRDLHYIESLENQDRIYLYHNKKRVIDGWYVRPPGKIEKSYLALPKEKPTDEQVIVDYENLKLFFRSNFSIRIFRRHERNPNAHYPIIKYGVETPLVPY